ncbi:enoyl-CoA hydratase [Virgibacillus sp. 179-BFC.A HS]|uniref:Enoyl-CoA hydratase n=1 Tax=Tigheibacillus jepli TaxID=3035914 RepID=A0ABU5CIT5_9BACI|nr:enoyl-CoA hydratase [Virgibacillus sp. 179-BFC.A HS]MDY0406262.1 enoyl-CoA hydratase [Virgibacillus sp. 179-BFC.A HS]
MIDPFLFTQLYGLNPLNKEMLDELLKTLQIIAQNADSILIIAGKGKAFCAGGDIKMMLENTDREQFDAIMDTISEITHQLYVMPKIVLAAIHGSAVGLGLSLALTSDYLIANESAKLGMLFIGIGLAPDGGGHYLLENRIGTQQAKQFIWSGSTVSAEKAKDMQLVDVVTKLDPIKAAEAVVQNLQQAPLTAMIKTKLLYHKKHAPALQISMQEEKENQLALRQTRDHQEGVQAFIEKRKPTFTGY